jgi:hypothetical protein
MKQDFLNHIKPDLSAAKSSSQNEAKNSIVAEAFAKLQCGYLFKKFGCQWEPYLGK